MPNGTGEMLCVLLRLHADNPGILAMVCELLVQLVTTYPELNETRENLRRKTKSTLKEAMNEFKEHEELQRWGSTWLAKKAAQRKR